MVKKKQKQNHKNIDKINVELSFSSIINLITYLFGSEKDISKQSKKLKRKYNRKKTKKYNFKKVLKPLKSILMISFIIFSIYYIRNQLFTNKIFNIKKFIIVGNKNLNNQFYHKLISNYCVNKNIPLNYNIFKIHLMDLNRYISDNCNVVKKIIIQRVLPDKVKLIIKEYNPYIFVNYGKTIKYCDDNGNVFDIYNNKINNLIVLDMLNQKSEIIYKSLKVIKSFTKKIKTNISEIKIKKLYAEIFFIKGYKVLIDYTNLNMKSKYLDILLANFEEKKINYIDLRFNKTYISFKGV